MKAKTAWGNFGLFAFLILYFLFEACFVSFISLGAGLDDAELISNLSFWNWGYGGSQPPLYTWLAYGLTQAFGLHFALLQFLRFALLGSGFFAVYIGLRLLRVAKPLAAFACLSIFLLPQITWESQRALIHSVLGTAGSAWSFAAFIWFVQKPCYKRALWLAAAITIAILGKYNGLIFIAALFMSGFFLPPVRQALMTRYFPAAVLAALALMSPALLFMALHPESVMERAVKFQAGAGGGWFADRIHGLLDLLRAGINFILPALAAAVIIGFIVWLKNKKQPGMADITRDKTGQAGEIRQAMRFLRIILLCGLALCALMVLFSGATHIKDRWLQPVLFLAPPYAALWLAQLDFSGRAPRIFGLLGLAAACFVPVLLYVNLYMSSHRDKLPLQNLDYPALYAELSANGPIATLLAPDPFYIGNIRLINPQIKTLFAETPFAAKRLARPLVILWKDKGEAETARGARETENRHGAAEINLPQKLLPILAEAELNAQNLPPARLFIVPYRLQKAGGQKSERIYYIYLP